MSTLIHSTAEPTNAYIQTVFNWDTANSVEKTAVSSPIAVSSQSRPQVRTNSKTTTKPTASENTRPRRVGCEHVGSALASVLGGYGISIDALISEIERLKSLS